MLGKLFQNEWKSFSLAPTVVMVILGIFTGVTMFTLSNFLLVDSLAESDSTYGMLLQIISILVIFAYLFCVAAASFSITLCTAIRFYKNLFTDEGYLMFTLPVTPAKLLLSKGLVAALWRIISIALMMLSIFLIAFTGFICIGEMSYVEFFKDFAEFFVNLFDWQTIQEYINVPVPLLILWLLLLGTASLISKILFIYTCICLGQLFQKHKVGGSILCYFGLRFITQFFRQLFTQLLSEQIYSLYYIEEIGTGAWLSIMFISLLFMWGICVGMYCLCIYLMTKKLNLE